MRQSTTCHRRRQGLTTVIVCGAAAAAALTADVTLAFTTPRLQASAAALTSHSKHALFVSSSSSDIAASASTDDTSAPRKSSDQQTQLLLQQQQQQKKLSLQVGVDDAVSVVKDMQEPGVKKLLSKFEEKIGRVSEDRLIFPEYDSGEIPRLFSSLEYNRCVETGQALSVSHAAGSALGAAALVAGTTVGAGVLALPQATMAAGFLPSSAAMAVAWCYMTMSGLLIAELTLNQSANTGRPGQGLLHLYKTSLGEPLSTIGTGAFFFLHYAMMVAYIAQGGVLLDGCLTSLGLNGDGAVPGSGQLAFTLVTGLSLYFASPGVIQKVNNGLVLGVAVTFLGIMGIGAQSADFAALIDPINQHPAEVVNCFPILFLALVYQNVVPTVVTQLEGDRTKITQAIVGGTTAPFLLFLAWNAVVLGNVLGCMDAGDATGVVDPVALLQSGAVGNAGALLGPLVGAFSSLALITSLLGFTVALEDAWTDVFNIPSRNPQSAEFQQWKPALFALIFLPPLALSVANPDIFFQALEYGGAFGVSTLFLVLPPIMVWKERYSDQDRPLATKPMVPFGKLTLGSMWKAAGTLILEQGAEKLGVFDFVKDRMDQFQA